VFPVTKVDQEKDQAEADYKPMNDQDEFNHKLYSPATYVNAPISLQLVGRRYEDEKTFEALEFIQEAIGLPLNS
jgi:amidase